MSSADTLSSLHQAVVDACNGYEEAVKDAKEPAMIALFNSMKALHEKHHSELHAALLASGQKPDDTGSFMSTVHRAVIGARAAVTGLGESALSSFAGGEVRLVAAYDRAMKEAGISAATAQILVRQRSEILANIQTMRR
jgi:uncharacterized protein (TIGR02284 family)